MGIRVGPFDVDDDAIVVNSDGLPDDDDDDADTGNDDDIGDRLADGTLVNS